MVSKKTYRNDVEGNKHGVMNSGMGGGREDTKGKGGEDPCSDRRDTYSMAYTCERSQSYQPASQPGRRD